MRLKLEQNAWVLDRFAATDWGAQQLDQIPVKTYKKLTACIPEVEERAGVIRQRLGAHIKQTYKTAESSTKFEIENWILTRETPTYLVLAETGDYRTELLQRVILKDKRDRLIAIGLYSPEDVRNGRDLRAACLLYGYFEVLDLLAEDEDEIRDQE